MDSYEFTLEILSCNNVDKGIVPEIKDLGLKYKSEFGKFNHKQKYLVVRFLEEELLG